MTFAAIKAQWILDNFQEARRQLTDIDNANRVSTFDYLHRLEQLRRLAEHVIVNASPELPPIVNISAEDYYLFLNN